MSRPAWRRAPTSIAVAAILIMVSNSIAQRVSAYRPRHRQDPLFSQLLAA